MSPNFPLIAWSPDADSTSPGLISNVTNMIPTARGYAPDYGMSDAVINAATLPLRAISADLLQPGVSDPILVLGTTDGLYAVSAGLKTLTRASPYNSATFLRAWRFAAFGPAVLAVQFNNVLQRTLGASAGTAMVNVSGAPTADTMCVQSGFVMLGNTYSTAGWAYVDGWWCSALQDETDWTLDVATQCARGRLTQTPGAIVRMVTYQNDIIAFKGTSILRGTYVGQANGVWQWTVVSTEVGLASHNAVVEADGLLYFVGNDGFYRFNGGGLERIRSAPWEWYVVDRASDYAGFASGAYDPVRRVVRWHYGQTGETLDSCLTYHPDSDRWGHTNSNCSIPINVPYEALPSVKSLATKRTIFPAGIMDATSKKPRIYSATPNESALDTGDVGDDDTVTTLTKVRARFLSAPTVSFARHLHRMRLSDALSLGDEVARVDGKYDFSRAARWHRVSFSQTGMYEIVGFSVNAPGSGKR